MQLWAFGQQRICWIATEKGDLVLDSLAGSGTTAHAVMQLNSGDGGDRKFILVQQPYNTKENERDQLNICRQVTAERVQRVIKGYLYLRRRPRGRTEQVEQAGLGGSFTYATVGEPLFGEYRDFGENLPSFDTLAAYVFYTETSREADPRLFDPESGFIGATEAAGGTSYYLLYTPNKTADRELSLVTLKHLAALDSRRNWVVYCEKIWFHDDQLKKFELENNTRIRPMVVPFNLK